MPIIKLRFKVYAPPEAIAGIFKNAQDAASIVPHVVEVRIVDASHFVTAWEGQMGPIKKRFTVNAQILEQTLGRYVFVGEGDGLKLKGTVEYGAIDREKTLLTVELDVDPGVGIVASIVNYVIRKEENDNTLYVRQKLEEKLKSRVELEKVGS